MHLRHRAATHACHQADCHGSSGSGTVDLLCLAHHGAGGPAVAAAACSSAYYERIMACARACDPHRWGREACALCIRIFRAMAAAVGLLRNEGERRAKVRADDLAGAQKSRWFLRDSFLASAPGGGCRAPPRPAGRASKGGPDHTLSGARSIWGAPDRRSLSRRAPASSRCRRAGAGGRSTASGGSAPACACRRAACRHRISSSRAAARAAAAGPACLRVPPCPQPTHTLPRGLATWPGCSVCPHVGRAMAAGAAAAGAWRPAGSSPPCPPRRKELLPRSCPHPAAHSYPRPRDPRPSHNPAHTAPMEYCLALLLAGCLACAAAQPVGGTPTTGAAGPTAVSATPSSHAPPPSPPPSSQPAGTQAAVGRAPIVFVPGTLGCRRALHPRCALPGSVHGR
jgi:hypothetical protein